MLLFYRSLFVNALFVVAVILLFGNKTAYSRSSLCIYKLINFKDFDEPLQDQRGAILNGLMIDNAINDRRTKVIEVIIDGANLPALLETVKERIKQGAAHSEGRMTFGLEENPIIHESLILDETLIVTKAADAIEFKTYLRENGGYEIPQGPYIHIKAEGAEWIIATSRRKLLIFHRSGDMKSLFAATKNTRNRWRIAQDSQRGIIDIRSFFDCMRLISILAVRHDIGFDVNEIRKDFETKEKEALFQYAQKIELIKLYQQAEKALAARSSYAAGPVLLQPKSNVYVTVRMENSFLVWSYGPTDFSYAIHIPSLKAGELMIYHATGFFHLGKQGNMGSVDIGNFGRMIHMLCDVLTGLRKGYWQYPTSSPSSEEPRQPFFRLRPDPILHRL